MTDRIAGIWSPILLSLAAASLLIGLIRAFIYAVKTLHSTWHLESSLSSRSEPVAIADLTGDPNDTGEIRIFRDNMNITAFSLGLLSPEVYISSTAVDKFDPRNLDIIIQHELGHKARRDPLRRFLLKLLSELLWFVPIMRIWSGKAILSSEADCDLRAMVKGYSETEIAETLVNVASSPNPPLASPEVAWNSIADQLELRVRLLLGEKLNRLVRVPLKVATISMIILLLVATAGGTVWVKATDIGGFDTMIQQVANGCSDSHQGAEPFKVFGIPCPHCNSAGQLNHH